MADNTNPSSVVRAVTKSDTTQLLLTLGQQNTAPRALYVGVGGDISVQFDNLTTTVVFKNVPTGAILPIRPYRVMDATTATDIVALY